MWQKKSPKILQAIKSKPEEPKLDNFTGAISVCRLMHLFLQQPFWSWKNPIISIYADEVRQGKATSWNSDSWDSMWRAWYPLGTLCGQWTAKALTGRASELNLPRCLEVPVSLHQQGWLCAHPANKGLSPCRLTRFVSFFMRTQLISLIFPAAFWCLLASALYWCMILPQCAGFSYKVNVIRLLLLAQVICCYLLWKKSDS